MLKAELHTHVKGDPEDNIPYTAEMLIDHAAELNFDVLGITCHDYVYEEQEPLKKYAEKKNILLLFGAEITIEGKHTLVYNITNKERKKIKTFEELKRLKINKLKKEQNNTNKLKKEGINNRKLSKKPIFVIAPHPFNLAPSCPKKNILKYGDLFDAWEFSFFFTKWFNPNKKTLRLAKKLNKPVVGNSDVHLLKDLGRTYTLIDAPLSEKAIFAAIKQGKTKVVGRPLKGYEFCYVIVKFGFSFLKKRFLGRSQGNEDSF
ncbi:MAG: PHP domain-containing protein [Nanoarchaeota archaeon]